MIMKKIGSVKFTLLGPEMIRKMSSIEIKTPETYDKDGYPMEGGLMDPHLGVINPGIKCKTCGKNAKYEMKTPFGVYYYCGVHIRKWRDNMCAVINLINI